MHKFGEKKGGEISSWMRWTLNIFIMLETRVFIIVQDRCTISRQALSTQAQNNG